jgi:hypothetical protein
VVPGSSPGGTTFFYVLENNLIKEQMAKLSQKSILFLLFYFGGMCYLFASPVPPAPATAPNPPGLNLEVDIVVLLISLFFAYLLIKKNKIKKNPSL